MSILHAIAAIEAVLAVVGWFWKPRRRIVERRLSFAALMLALIGACTAQYTTAALIMMACTLVLLGAVFVVKSSLLAFIAFDKHVTQASVLFDGCTKEEVSALAKTLVPMGLSAILTAQGLEDIARRGESFRSASGILDAAGTLSVALSADFRLCIDLLISLKRYFDFDGGYMDIADKTVVSAKNGVQPHEIRLALAALRKERAAGPPLKLDKFLAAIVTLRRKDQDLELSGEALGAFINELIAASGPASAANPTADYAQRILVAIDLVDNANMALTARSMELQTEITRRALAGERILPAGDPLLAALSDVLLDSASALERALGVAGSAKPPKRLSQTHGRLIESLRTQLEGTHEAQRGVQASDFGSVSAGLKRRGQGVDSMLGCANAMRGISRKRHSRSHRSNRHRKH